MFASFGCENKLDEEVLEPLKDTTFTTEYTGDEWTFKFDYVGIQELILADYIDGDAGDITITYRDGTLAALDVIVIPVNQSHAEDTVLVKATPNYKFGLKKQFTSDELFEIAVNSFYAEEQSDYEPDNSMEP